jgi:hypothetical protein
MYFVIYLLSVEPLSALNYQPNWNKLYKEMKLCNGATNCLAYSKGLNKLS